MPVNPFKRTQGQQAGQRGEERKTFRRTRFFNQNRTPYQAPSTPDISSTVFAKPPAPRPPQPPVTTQPPPPPPPVNLFQDTRFFKTPIPPPPPVTVTPPVTDRTIVPANPFAAFGSRFDPRINPALFFAPTESLRNDLQQSRHGFTNADRQFWQDFVSTVTTGHFGREHERRVQRMMRTPAGWLKLAGEYMQAKGLYTPAVPAVPTEGTVPGGITGGKPGTGGLGG